MSDFTLSPSRSRLRDRQTQRTTNILSLPNAWAGEGISFQSLPDQAQTHRDRECALFNRAADQNLVSEPTHEMEEREQPDLHGDRNWTDRSVSRAGTQWRDGRREGWRQEERIANNNNKKYKNHTMTITNQHNYLKIYMDSRATSPHDCYHAALTNFISCWTTGVLILRNPKLFQPQFGRCVVWRTEGFFVFVLFFIANVTLVLWK